MERGSRAAAILKLFIRPEVINDAVGPRLQGLDQCCLRAGTDQLFRGHVYVQQRAQVLLLLSTLFAARTTPLQKRLAQVAAQNVVVRIPAFGDERLQGTRAVPSRWAARWTRRMCGCTCAHRGCSARRMPLQYEGYRPLTAPRAAGGDIPSDRSACRAPKPEDGKREEEENKGVSKAKAHVRN
eukprot:scaffold5703_cov135-Isochrysis_galbana.AAC.3